MILRQDRRICFTPDQKESTMQLEPRQKSCACGNSLTVDRTRVWCTQCGKPVYYEDKDQNKHKWNTIYVGAMIVGTILLLAYMFIELIARPWLS